MEYRCIFKRLEKKYLLTEKQYLDIRAFLEKYTYTDKYGKSSIRNIYFDTDDYSLIRASIEKPVFKEKLRLRSYGSPDKNGTVFLEIKRKYNGIVYKRRAPMTLQAADDFLYSQNPNRVSSQILKEIDWFLKLYSPEKKIFISYDREALFSKEDQNLRITFDTNIGFRTSNLDLTDNSSLHYILPADRYLMEIKIPASMPLWLCSYLSHKEIFPISFSKYGKCYCNFIFQNLGGLNYA